MFDSSPVETESHANAQGDEGAKNLNTVWHEAKNCLVTTPAALQMAETEASAQAILVETPLNGD